MKTGLAVERASVTKHHIKLLTGETMDKFPVVCDNGKTIIFISDRSKEEETRQRYIMRGQNAVVR